MKYVVYYSPPDYQAKLTLAQDKDINPSMGWFEDDLVIIERLQVGHSAVIDGSIFIMRVE